jgi:small subunit ribosomal protein S20
MAKETVPLANTKSAIKAARQSEARRAANRSTRTRVRTATKAAQTAQAPSQDEAFRSAQSVIDRATKHGVLHWRAAARRKSRLAKRLQAAK